jgi:hypothetical protein
MIFGWNKYFLHGEVMPIQDCHICKQAQYTFLFRLILQLLRSSFKLTLDFSRSVANTRLHPPVRLYVVLPHANLLLLFLLTAVGLMSGGSIIKIGRTYKKWSYIARKQNIHLTTKQHVHLTRNQHISQNFTVQYK